MSDSAFKNWFNDESVKAIGKAVKDIYPQFNEKKFNAISKEFGPLELKGRVLLITKELKTHLPSNYKEALSIIVEVIEKSELKGFSLWPFSEYISQFGLDYFDESMKAMYILTQKFTSEFAVRPFILKNHARVLKYFKKWTSDKNVHVRRWVSEGSRPMLPWGGNIPLFIMDPTHTLVLLDQLRFDEELYVRKSVANHLNDISKNHPKVVIEILKIWEKSAPEKHIDKIQWIKKHALRVLIKKGNKDALKLMGASEKVKATVSEINLNKEKFRIGESLELEFSITSSKNKVQKIVVDYAIDFVKSNGERRSKVFKLKTIELAAFETIVIRKKHSLKKITTMTYYKGRHQIKIQMNGLVTASREWDFLVS